MKGKQLTERELNKILSNPFYCIRIHEMLCEYHEPIVSEGQFIKVGEKLIKELGAKEYLKLLLENLKGNWV